MKVILLFLLIDLIFCSCINDVKKEKNNNIIAYIDSIPVYYYEFDEKVKQELYDELYRIYLIRKISLDECIKEKILQLEAQKMNITKEKLIESLFENQINNYSLQKYIEINNFKEKISDLREKLVFYDINSIEGRKILMKRFKDFILNNYIDSIKRQYKIEITLKSPILKYNEKELKDIIVYYRRNLNSNITFLLISDFECDICRKNHHNYEMLYNKYKNKIRFGYTYYGSYVTNSSIACECAAKQGKFWEMYNEIYKLENIPDTTTLFNIAKEIGLNLIDFKKNFYDTNIYSRIEQNLFKINSIGIYATPTILINNKIIFNSTSIHEIENEIIQLINNK